MFKKRGKFSKSQQTNTKNEIKGETDGFLVDINDSSDINDDDLPLPVLKRPKNKILFKKSNKNDKNLNSTGTESVQSESNASVSAENDKRDELDNFNEWYDDENNLHLNYYEQYDEEVAGPENSNLSGYDDEEIVDQEEDRFYESGSNSNDIDISVHRLTPPFLNSGMILSRKIQIVDVIKDKSGDLYKLSRNGSNILNEKRQLNDREQNSKDNISNKRTALHKVITRNSPTNNEEKDEEQEEEQDVDDNDLISGLNKSGKSNTSNRENLPAYKVKNQLINIINENQVSIIIGETGSGKTTQLPQILYEQGYAKTGVIGITQPRRMAAVSVSKRVSEEMEVELGQEVGFAIRFNDLTSKATKIKFMTDGVLLRETLVDSTLNKYSCIIMDEAHERSLNTDILFGIFKKMLAVRRDFKLIITSATMNSLKFSRFFNNAVQFKIPGKTYPVEIMYQSIPSVDYIDSAVKQSLKIHLMNSNMGKDGDVLVFMTGQEDIEVTCQLLEEELSKLKKINPKIKDLDILPIYSNLSSQKQTRVFQDSPNRKCIVATNIAETSLTFKNIKFVVDSGLMKLKVFNPKLNMDSLQLVPISKAQANQRSGRAGRTSPGQSFRLYTLTTFDEEMWDEPIPEIQRSNLISIILLLKNLNINEIGKFPFIDKPSSESLETAQYELWSIGALDNFGGLTTLGRLMSHFPIDPVLAKLLIISNFQNFGCCLEMIKIVSMLSVPQIFVRPKKDEDLQKKVEKVRENFQIIESDHLTLLNIFNQFNNVKEKDRDGWCKKNYFNVKSLKNATEIFKQLLQLVEKSLLKHNKEITSCGQNWEVIKECVCACFFTNAGEFYKHGQYRHCRSGLEMFINPNSSLNGVGDLPKYVVFHEILLTGEKQYMNHITCVKGEWLIKYGSIFYSKRVRGVNSRQNQQLKEQKFNQLIEFEKEKMQRSRG